MNSRHHHISTGERVTCSPSMGWSRAELVLRPLRVLGVGVHRIGLSHVRVQVQASSYAQGYTERSLLIASLRLVLHLLLVLQASDRRNHSKVIFNPALAQRRT
jgi:hypothetical protein